MAKTPEGKFKTQFIKDLRKVAKPLAVLQYKQDATTVAGFPDTIVILEGITIYIEFKKSKTAGFRPGQKEWNKRLNENGHFAFICYPGNADEVLEEIKRLV